MPTPPITVVETPTFRNKSLRLLGDEDSQALVSYLARNPDAGDIVQGTGGVRKLRWARPHGGKSGGFRVIYYYHDEGIPLFALTIYPKNEKADLNQAERNELRRISAALVAHYKKGVSLYGRRHK